MIKKIFQTTKKTLNHREVVRTEPLEQVCSLTRPDVWFWTLEIRLQNPPGSSGDSNHVRRWCWLWARTLSVRMPRVPSHRNRVPFQEGCSDGAQMGHIKPNGISARMSHVLSCPILSYSKNGALGTSHPQMPSALLLAPCSSNLKRLVCFLLSLGTGSRGTITCRSNVDSPRCLLIQKIVWKPNDGSLDLIEFEYIWFGDSKPRSPKIPGEVAHC